MFYHEVPGVAPPGAYAVSEEYDDAVRIGIEDSPVDFTHPYFHGRIQLEGAALAYWRPLASHAAQRAFASCGVDNVPCRVFRVDSGGDDARLQALARTVLEVTRQPVADNRWFLHDRSRGDAGWFELPPAADLAHGTRVALVALGQRFHPFPAPDPVIVPMAVNLDPVEQFEERHYFAGLVAELRNDPARLEEIDRQHSEELRRRNLAAAVINASYGASVDLNSLGGRSALRAWRDDLDLLRRDAPHTWGEFVQRGRLTSDRTIRVWAAGNHEPGSGVPASGGEGTWYDEFPNVLADDGYRNLNSLGPYYYPELRGEHIRVTALSTDEERLAPYADPCGALPSDWSQTQYGKHYCLAAPGTLAEDVQGTSFAAPFVSGVLARMARRFPGVTPQALVRRLMDTADGWREDGFDGGIYVVRAEREDPEDEESSLVQRIVDVDVDGNVNPVDLTIHPAVPTVPEPRDGEFRVVQRGCGPRGSDYLVRTGEPENLCVIWRSPDPETTPVSARDARERALERFEFVYGAGRVDVDAEDGAFAPVGTVHVSAPGVPSAPISTTRLQAPAAWGALGDRLSGLSLAAFDALDFPFFYRLEELVADEGSGVSSPIPDFLPEWARTRACDPLRGFAPGLFCTRRASETAIQPLASPDGAGAAFRLGEDSLLSGFTRAHGRLDGAGYGAFSFEGGSSLAALHLDRAWMPGGSDRWRVDGSLTVAVDVPRGLGASTPSLFTAGSTLLSEWNVGLTRTSRIGHTRFSLAQPPRAEAGHGRFTVPNGRREDGTRLYERHRVSLVPSHRELTLRIAHQRAVRAGELVLSVHRTENPGHRAARPEHGAGMAYRRRW